MSEKLTVTQEKLHQKFKFCGSKHLQFRQKCIGLLPEIFTEKIYQKKGFDSIFEYAAKLAGLSHDQVKRALSLHAKFEDKPILKRLLISGAVSINKLAKIASIATLENQQILADQVRLLPCRSVETLVRDVRAEKSLAKDAHNSDSQNPNGSPKPLFEDNFVHVNKRLQQPDGETLELSAEVQQKLLELKKLGHDVNKIILELLEKREKEIDKKIADLGEKAKATNSRYIKIETRKVLQEKFGSKCTVQTCHKPAEEIHHTQKFSLTKIHDPRYMPQYCEDHHKISHTIDVKYCELRLAKSFRR